MNSSIIRYVLGTVLKIEGGLLLIPCLTAAIYHEQTGYAYLLIAIITAFIGFVMTCKKPRNTVFYLKEGCVTTALSWIFLSIFGALPFVLSGEFPSFTDALFETISGFTTTGASILSDVESLSHASLIWRSFTHWIGGMGVLVFLLAIVPMSGGSHMNLMRAESPGPSVGKLVPKVKSTARILYLIYIGLTLVQFFTLLLGGMTVFEALNTAFSTAGTGGFGFKNDSIASYSPYIQWNVTIFMILFGINFNAFYLLVFGYFKKAFSIEEVKAYLLVIIAAIGIIFVETVETVGNAFTALTDASFQVASIITTTGFSTVDFDKWPVTCKAILVLLMFIGACAGSTGGGIKVSRFIILIKTIKRELQYYIHPKCSQQIKMDGKMVEVDIVRSTNVYFITFMIIFCASVFALSFEGHDLVTNFTAVAATINNIGPGLELVGPTQNFGLFSPFSKYVLMFDMLAGRLELFPLLILFHPTVWKDLYVQKCVEKKRKKELGL